MKNSSRRKGYTLVEMLVVLGIVIVVMGILLPVVMKARRSSRQTACASNMRQIGQMVHMYADANNDYITLGYTFMLERYIPSENKLEGEGAFVYSCYPIAHGVPSAGLGPLFLCGMLSSDNAKMLYCPTDPDERLAWKLWQPKVPGRKAQPAPGTTVRISYFCRPINKLWVHTRLDSPKPEAIWPFLLPRMDDMRGRAIYSERLWPGFPHGSDASPIINVLYQDGSVKGIQVRPSSGDSFLPDELPSHPLSLPTDLPEKLIGTDHVGLPGWSLLDEQYGN